MLEKDNYPLSGASEPAKIALFHDCMYKPGFMTANFTPHISGIAFIVILTHTHRKNSPEELKTLDIGTRLLDNVAFVRIHVV